MQEGMGDVIATLRSGPRCWAVASIHGEADRLRALHGGLGRRIRPGDNLIAVCFDGAGDSADSIEV